MRRNVLPLLLIAILSLGTGFSLPLARQPAAMAQDFQPLPFDRLARRVSDRYAGRLVGAEIRRPSPREHELGAALVYEFRLLTPEGNLLRIRLDARTGRFLEVAGRGQLQALRRGKDRP